MKFTRDGSLWLVKLGVVLLAFALASSLACASLPPKQTAVATLSASEIALEAAHDAERKLCAPSADQTAAIQHCDGPVAELTDARHQEIAKGFSKAFQTQIVAATALKLWRSGEPPPSSVAEYQRDLTALLTLLRQAIPATETTVAKVQDAIDKAAAVAVIVGVK